MRCRRWLCSVLALALAACSSAHHPTPGFECLDCSLLLISVDTLRADHLGVYGYSRDTSPRIDLWANQSIVFERAYSTAEKTADSHMSIFTGLHPAAHRVLNTDEADATVRLSPSIQTFTEVLQAAGFATAGFHGGGNLSAHYGFARGFDTYEAISRFDDPPRVKLQRAVSWLEDRDPDRFFLFFHTYWVHDPYLPSPQYARMFGEAVSRLGSADLQQMLASGGFESVRDRFWSNVDLADPADIQRVEALYDAAIREIDAIVASLIREVRRREPNTLVILVSDHGEAFGEHGRFLHSQLYEEIIRVPLIVSHPKLERPMRVHEVVSLVDLGPTLVDILVGGTVATATGSSFAGLFDGSGASRGIGEAYSEKLWMPDREPKIPLVSMRSLVSTDGTKVIESASGTTEIYDLQRDPWEEEDLSGSRSATVQQQKLRDYAAQSTATALQIHGDRPSAVTVIDEEAEGQLRALGYVD